MKKFISIVLLFLILLGGFLFYRRLQVTRELRELARGKTFQSYGVKIQIPPGDSHLHGFLNPFINIEKVTFDIGSWIPGYSFSVPEAKCVGHLWGPEAFELIFPKALRLTDEAVLDTLGFHLGKEGGIQRVWAHSIQIHNSKKLENSEILGPRIELGPWSGILPDYWTVGIKGLQWVRGDPKASQEKINLGSMQWDFVSGKDGNERRWKVSFRGKGGAFGFKDNVMDLKPWEMGFQGTLHEMSQNDLLSFFHGIVGELQQLPSTNLHQALSLYDKAIGFLLQLNFQMHSSQYRWEGLVLKDRTGKNFLELGSNEGKGQSQYGSDKFSANFDGALHKVTAKVEESEFNFEAIKIQTQSDYHVSFENFFKSIFGYFRNTLEGKSALANPLVYLFSAFSQYPDQGLYELKIGKFHYATPKVIGDHRDLDLGMKIDAQGITYLGKDNFDQKFPEDPSKNIEGGKLELSLGFRLPWEKLLSLARGFLAEGKLNLDFLKNTALEKGGMESHWMVDLGKTWFSGQVDLVALIPLVRLLPDLNQANLWNDPLMLQQWKDQLKAQALKSFLAEGDFNFDFKIERFSKLQAMMEKFQSGSSLGLAVLAPYFVVDSQQDTFSIKLELKNGEVLLNGKPHEAINKILENYRGSPRLVSPP